MAALGSCKNRPIIVKTLEGDNSTLHQDVDTFTVTNCDFISLRKQSLLNIPQSLWDDIPRLKYPFFKELARFIASDAVPTTFDGSF